MNKEQIEQLHQLTHEQLCALVVSVYGIEKQIDKSIESKLLASDPVALAKHLKKQIQSIGRGRRIIDYRESSAFSRELDLLQTDIESLLPAHPKATFNLIDTFMNIHGKVLDRCDDSDGNIGDAFRDGAQRWVNAAVAWQASKEPCKLHWVEEVQSRHRKNDYGMWDNLIAHSLPLLGEKPLREMAQQFEIEIAQRNEVKVGHYDSDLSNAQHGLSGVAKALADVTMYERSYTLVTPEPNELQKESIVKFCLGVDDGESALKWLVGKWQPRFYRSQQILLDQAYRMTGQEDDLLDLRRQKYSKEPSFENLQALLKISSKKEQKELQARASSLASESDDIITAVGTLLQLQDMDAVSSYVLQHPDRLQDAGYYTLAEWAGTFEKQGMALPAVLVYRVLLLDILESAKTKAYRHAAKYYRALERLDGTVTDYKTWPDRSGFNDELVEKHGRKRSFWGLVE